jgi:hypothetical protein
LLWKADRFELFSLAKDHLSTPFDRSTTITNAVASRTLERKPSYLYISRFIEMVIGMSKARKIHIVGASAYGKFLPAPFKFGHH